MNNEIYKLCQMLEELKYKIWDYESILRPNCPITDEYRIKLQSDYDNLKTEIRTLSEHWLSTVQ